jgi:uncharacterized protein (TIGR03083 family)
VEIPAHIDALRIEGERMAAVAAGADPGGAVPTCPDWTVRDLIRHTGSVHRWATGFVAGGRTEPSPGGLDEAVEAWPSDEDLAGWLGQGCTDLVAVLVAASDDLQCWTFLAAPSPRAMWARRQAHETAVHRVDAQLATGTTVTRCAPAFAADGIDELLVLFVPRRGAKLRADPPATLSVRCTDVDASWQLRMDAEGVTTTVGAGGDATGVDAGAACTVSGTAHDLYLALWNRTGADGLALQGDRAVLGQFSGAVRIR